jgi:hypothetical protein
MKRLNIKFFIVTALLTAFLMSCSKILDEQARATYTTAYFQSKEGIMGEVTNMYAHLRQMYGNGYVLNNWETGTDEATWGQQSGGNSSFQVHDFSIPGAKPRQDNNDAGTIWTTTFTNINTANAVIEKAAIQGVTAPIIAEARFFRAFDYFLLVQTFGGVPLDLGSGRLKYNEVAVRTSKRDSVTAVYTKAIFPDLRQAIIDLPDAPRVPGAVTKTAARLFLSKSYLTYGWWLENPNSIPTYPEVTGTRIDPDGHNAQWYYQQAYDIASTAIASPGPYSLQPTYYDVNVATNDRNSEMLLYADHTQTNEVYNGSSLTYESGGNGANYAGWFLTWNYTNMTSAAKTDWTSKINSVQRYAAQPYGRPWVRMAPPIGVFTNTFADKTNDSRYDGTFTTVYRGNWNLNSSTQYPFLYNANNLKVYMDSAILTFLDVEPSVAIDYSNSVYKSSIGVGVLPGRADYVVSPNGISRLVYPGLWKLGPYRTDNNGGLGYQNAGSTRPFPVAKFSELFFVAAEAAVKGATTTAITGTYANDGSAKALINIIRARAGKWRWSNGGNVAKVQDHSADMTAATPATIDINYILAERSREYYGEGYRWYDLVRTQKWGEIGGSFQICGTDAGDHTPKTYTRDIPVGYYLRPIPQAQFDNMLVSDAEKKDYQNPAYR